jgi:hypothetical protein
LRSLRCNHFEVLLGKVGDGCCRRRRFGICRSAHCSVSSKLFCCFFLPRDPYRLRKIGLKNAPTLWVWSWLGQGYALLFLRIVRDEMCEGWAGYFKLFPGY